MASRVHVDVRFDGTDNVSPHLDNIRNKSQQLEQGVNRTGKAFSAIASGINEANGALRQTNPAMSAAISAVDNFTISTVAAAAASRGWAGAITALSGLLNPWTLLIIAAGAALAYFSAQMAEATKKSEEQFQALQKFVDKFNQLRRETELANAPNERARLEIQIAQERRRIILETTDDMQRQMLLEEQAAKASALRGQFARKEAEEAKKNAETEEQARAAARTSVLNQIEVQRAQTIEIKFGEIAALEYKAAIAGNSEAIKKLGEEGKELAEILKSVTLETAAAKFEAEKYKATVDNLTKLGEALDKQLEDEKEQIRELTKARQEYNQTQREHQLNLMRAAGAPEQNILAREIELRQREIEQLQARLLTPEAVRRIDELARANQVANVQLLKLKDTAIDVAGEVSRVVTDITSAVISGTLKWADIGRSILASFVRLALEQFTGFLRNMQQVAQAQGILAQAGAGVSVGGGGGGSLGGLGGIINTAGTLISSLPGASGVMTGGGASGMFQNIIGIFKNIFNVGSYFFTSLGTTISTAVVNGISAISTTAGTAVSGALATLSSLSWIPYIGWAIAAITAIYRIIANQQERPNVRLGAEFGGIGVDPTTGEITPGTIDVGIGRKVGIKNAQASQIAQNLETRLTLLADQWVAILNIFPDMVKKQLEPALEVTNAILNQSFRKLKFSPGGSRNIQQELEAISGPSGQGAFLTAFLPAIVTGIDIALQRSGINVRDQFAGGLSRLQPATNFEGAKKVISDITDLVTLASQISDLQVQKFLTGRDIEAITGQFAAVIGTSEPQAFGAAMEELKTNIKPFLDAVSQSMQQTAEIFGRGLIAAMEAATESDARLVFLNSLNTGIKDMVFQGLSEAFIASAQFADLLAPLQKSIRESVEQGLIDGIVDQDAFRQGILPAMEEILSRAELLEPMIGALQQFGEEIKRRLGLTVEEAVTTGLTESAQVFGQSLIDAMNEVTGSPLDRFSESFNTAIKDAVFSGIVQSFLATGFVEDLLKPLTETMKKAVEQSRETGTFIAPDIAAIIQDLSLAGDRWAPLIEFLSTIAGQVRTTLNLNPAPEPAPAPAPTNVVINLNGVGTVDQSAIPELARRINFMLEPILAPRA